MEHKDEYGRPVKCDDCGDFDAIAYEMGRYYCEECYDIAFGSLMKN
ncbi:hypothetical protein Dip510_001721 [Elusimicrobium posterum]